MGPNEKSTPWAMLSMILVRKSSAKGHQKKPPFNPRWLFFIKSEFPNHRKQIQFEDFILKVLFLQK